MDTTPVLEALPEIIELALWGIGSIALAALGTFIERFAVLTVLEGPLALGGWFAFMGTMAFIFAYMLFTDKFQSKLASFRSIATDS